MKVVVVTGICVEHDAISAAAVSRAELLRSLPGVTEVTLITGALSRRTTVRTVVVDNAWEVATHAAVQAADLVIFHWGIYNPLFDALVTVGSERPTVVQFHNLTPAEFLTDQQQQIHRDSVRQIQLIDMHGSAVWADSPFNAFTLESMGLAAGRRSVVPFPIERAAPLGRGRRRSERTVRLLTVGRLVEAKGIDVLIAAMPRVVDALECDVALVLAGNADLSDPRFTEQLHDDIERTGLSDVVSIRENLTDRQLWREYDAADIVVSPSRHEGLCVPVFEAYLSGCRVVGSDAGNLPNVVQPPDPIVPVGDAEALADAIVGLADQIRSGSSTVPTGVDDLLFRHSRAGVRQRMVAEIAELTGIDLERSGRPAAVTTN